MTPPLPPAPPQLRAWECMLLSSVHASGGIGWSILLSSLGTILQQVFQSYFVFPFVTNIEQ